MIGALALARGEADGLLCGLEGRYSERLGILRDMHWDRAGRPGFSAMSLMITNKGAFFIADTHVRREPSAAEIAEIGHALRRPCPPLRPHPENRAGVEFGFRLGGFALRRENARPRSTFCATPRRISKSMAR